MKRLLYVLHGLGVGGTEIIVANLARHFSKDYQIGVLALDHKGKIWDELSERSDLELYCAERKPGWSKSNFKNIFKVIEEFQPDIIHAHQYSPFFFSVCAKLFGKTNAKLIFTEHGRHYPDKVSLKRKLANQLFKFSVDQVTAVSQFSANALEDKEGLGKVDVIYNGIDIDSDQQRINLRTIYNLPEDKLIYGFIGSLRPVKNPLFLLDAFRIAITENENLHLFYLGDGSLKELIQNKIAEYHIDDHVTLLGEKRPSEAYLMGFDIFVQPSLSEANSLALLEAQALGLPCIVTDVGGSAEVVENNKNGLLVESNNIEQMANAIIEIANNHILRKNLGSYAKEVYQNKFTSSIMLNNYAHLYQT